MNEEWRTIPDFPDYMVSSRGQVLFRSRDSVKAISVNQQGIAHVLLVRDGQQFRRSVAILVATAFLPAPEASHFDTPVSKDGDRTNCNVVNLIWRPRWFAIKYHQQMKEGSRSWSQDPIYDVNTEIIYTSMWDAAITLTLLERDIFIGVTNWTPVFPGAYEFRFVEE